MDDCDGELIEFKSTGYTSAASALNGYLKSCGIKEEGGANCDGKKCQGRNIIGAIYHCPKCHQFDVCFDHWTAMYYAQYPDENNNV